MDDIQVDEVNHGDTKVDEVKVDKVETEPRSEETQPKYIEPEAHPNDHSDHDRNLPTQDSSDSLFIPQEDDTSSGSTTQGTKREQEDAPAPEGPRRKKARSGRMNPNFVLPYDVDKEKELSRLAVDQPCFEQAEKLVRESCDIVIVKAEALKGQGYADEEIATIIKKLKKMRFPKLQYPQPKPVGFLGDTAAGKSTLINSLLSKDNVAAESDEGSSGTSVIQELRVSELDQIDAFKAEVLLQRQRDIDLTIVKHFEDIYDFLFAEKDLDHDESTKLRDDYSTAIEFFTTLLCHREEIKDTTTAAAFFSKAHARDDAVMIQELKESINEIVKAACPLDFKANSIAELNKVLARFKGPIKTSPALPSLWPLVRKIITFVNARILSEGAILADMPGTSDVNKLRVQATREYLKTCDVVVIAHPIPRIQSQDSVWSNVLECVRSGKQSNIILVCTKIDDFNHNRTREAVSDKEAACLQELKYAADKVAMEIKELDADIVDAEDDGDSELGTKLNKKRRALVLERAKAEAKWQEANILMRNQRNEPALQQKFREITRSNATLRVHYVSSQVYQEHMRGYDQNKPPQLSLEATGIPALRQALFERPAKQKMASLKLLGSKTLPRVLLAIEMQCSKSRLERKQDVEVKVVAPCNGFQKLVTSLKTELKRACEDVLDNTILQCEAGWKSEARRHHDSWVKYKYARYAAFLRRDGVWKAPGKKEVSDWTAAINEISAEDFTAAFRAFWLRYDGIKVDFLGHADALLQNLEADLKESPELMGLNLEHFYMIIDKVREHVAERTAEAFRQLQDQIKHICYDATSTRTEGSYFSRTMQVTYNNCRLRKGDGVFKQYQGVMVDKLTGPKNVFHVVKDYVLAAVEQCIDVWAAEMSKKEEDVTKTAFRKQLSSAVEQAIEVVETKLKEQLDACAKYR
ncbi:hypothetical protein Tdes44962_MAKER03528 [Teratosphaeria destructans]|uniref:Uncharacterized protein n=1 Tax=Teratosphaeria destructans TaxID=418781 RepID=A0A9W7SPJ1_9PEZI|nr:hypothetical protein Tdes44962_MAKER03528 [Teratosphaeria destructans]